MTQPPTPTATTTARGFVPATPTGRFGLAASLAVVVYVALPAHPAAEIVPVTVHLGAALAVLAGIATFDPARRSSWRFVAMAIGVHAVAAAVHGFEVAGGGSAGRSAAIALLAYPPMLVGAWGVAARRLPRGFGDHRWAIATLAVCAIGWMVVVAPTLADGSFPMRSADRAGVHALLDALLIAVVGRRLIAQRRYNRSLWLATAAFVAWGDAHAVVGSQIYDGTFVSTSAAAGSLMIGPALLAMAALVPDMATTEEIDDSVRCHRRGIRELRITSMIVVTVTATMVVAATGAFSVWLTVPIFCAAILALAADGLERTDATAEQSVAAVVTVADEPVGATADHVPTDAPAAPAPPPPRPPMPLPRPSAASSIHTEPSTPSGQAGPPQEQLELVHLPYVDLGTGAVVGVEALVRWRHPVRGLLTPADFVGTADRSEVLRRIDDWVVTNAMRAAASWRSRAVIGINVGPNRLADRTWIDLLVDTLDSTGVAAERVIIETTERAFLDEQGPAFVHARRLRDQGMHIAIDDFGREIGSLRTLTRAPVDIIKVRAGALGRSNGRLDEAALRAARAAGRRTAVIGLDDPELLHQARELGVELGQGFLLCRPLPAEIVARRFDPGSDLRAARR